MMVQINLFFIEQEGVWMIEHKQIREMTEVLTGCQIGKSVDDEWEHVMEEAK